MDILLIIILFSVAWIGGHVLDKLFTITEKLVHQAKAPHGNGDVQPTLPAQKIFFKDNHPARLYVVPSATVRH